MITIKKYEYMVKAYSEDLALKLKKIWFSDTK